jgi:hypothetical protein
VIDLLGRLGRALAGSLRARLLVAAASCLLGASVLNVGEALADTTSFTTTGCTTFAVPAGVSSVEIAATGSAGEAGLGGDGGQGGTGDVVGGTLSALSAGQVLDVCVDYGGGAAGLGNNGGLNGAAGGGASGVALGSDFSVPVLIAGGGGGGGGGLTLSFPFPMAIPGGAGGNAGMLPTGGQAGGEPPCCTGQGTGGGGGTTSGGAGGADIGLGGGGTGSVFTSAGPGTGGAGATVIPNDFSTAGSGGGAGYAGGGGGASNGLAASGGGGGSDSCAASLTAPASLSVCGVTGTNSTFGTASVVLAYTPALPPTASITTPANGATYTAGQVVDSNFGCTDGSGGTGINSCLAQNGAPSGSPVDTSTLGLHTFTVSATSRDGLTGTASTSYTVVAPPSPGDLQIDTSGLVSRSSTTVDPGVKLSCPAGGPPCSATETVAVAIAGHPMSVGNASFTISPGGSVEAIFSLNGLGLTWLSDHRHAQFQISVSGQAQGGTTVTATKTISVSGQFATDKVLGMTVARNGTITFQVRVSAPGRVNVLVTAWQDNLANLARVLNPAAGRFVVARDGATAHKPETLTFHVRPNAKGRRLLAHPTYHPTLRVWVSYIPLYANQTDTGFYNLHPGQTCTACASRTWP